MVFLSHSNMQGEKCDSHFLQLCFVYVLSFPFSCGPDIQSWSILCKLSYFRIKLLNSVFTPPPPFLPASPLGASDFLDIMSTFAQHSLFQLIFYPQWHVVFFFGIFVSHVKFFPVISKCQCQNATIFAPTRRQIAAPPAMLRGQRLI